METDRNIQFFGQRPIGFHLRVVGRHTLVLQRQFGQHAKPASQELSSQNADIRQGAAWCLR